ncbi:glycosyltransferase family 9 protein [Azospira sp. I13]|uniref:glycosyltransferase family 9 protein n=1 Tax=Azospira sp. I13 TaxID=1765050 RepID=UPI0019124254|nr:glycosyltransferase family 9 protein [Azospira sp. I13]
MPAAAPMNILVIRLDFLGDMICTTPLLAALRREYPEARLCVLATRYNRVALAGNTDVDEIFTYVYSRQPERNERPGKLRALWDRLCLVRRLRKERFDLVVIPNGGRNQGSITFAHQLGARRIVFRDRETEFDDRNPEHVASRTIEHEALSGFRLLDLPPERHGPLHLKLVADPARLAAQSWSPGPPVVGLFVTARDPARIWPTAHWATLARALAETGGAAEGGPLRVAILWSPGRPDQPFIRGDDAQADTLRQALAGLPNVHFVPTPTVDDLIAVAANLDLAVTPDGAPVHICAALDRPVVALFENRREKTGRWYPLGVPQRLVTATAEAGGTSVGDIAPEAVLAAVQALLQESVRKRAAGRAAATAPS